MRLAKTAVKKLLIECGSTHPNFGNNQQQHLQVEARKTNSLLNSKCAQSRIQYQTLAAMCWLRSAFHTPG